ncbi:hypothetical protein RFI_21019 [Reticulomyxa filosa]|uniref:Ribosomal protein eL8/eL30/eS12/Gadd45 domain-containing protein n=1 Tax=Reticulomyxa filosa TaxID=46433 RepID=X6MR58_RETFI|nr:hypothetical protein RFI_21019 [Reticulomyxa filosa]|eukprot:ETO16334.1 hypothetical protein RFI_21019 [Reticulomyxa filosa]
MKLPETKKQKTARLLAAAKAQAESKPLQSEKPVVTKFGFNHVTNLIEAGRPKLVLIAHDKFQPVFFLNFFGACCEIVIDVDPIELVLWLPTLCVKKDIPFAIFRGKARLGTLVNQKTASCVALCDVKPEFQKEFDEIVKDCRVQYNDRFNYLRKKISVQIMGIKTRHKIAKRRRYRDAEAKKRKEAQEGEGKETTGK